MRFHLPVLLGLTCVLTYGACGSSDEKVTTHAEGGESGESGAATSEAAGRAGEHNEGGGTPSEGGTGGQGAAPSAGGAGSGGVSETTGGVAAGGAPSAGSAGELSNAGSGGEAGSPEPSPKVVFVSSVAYTGNLGGLDGADAKCAALALAANLPGTFKAWLSDSTGSPSTRFTQPTVDYVLPDHTVFAKGWSDLISPSPKPTFVNELGGAAPVSDTPCAGLNGGFAAWVSSNADGTPAPGVAAGDHTCSNWSSEAVETSTVGLGSPTANQSWVGFCSSGVPSCSKHAPIFCFEQ